MCTALGIQSADLATVIPRKQNTALPVGLGLTQALASRLRLLCIQHLPQSSEAVAAKLSEESARLADGLMKTWCPSATSRAQRPFHLMPSSEAAHVR